MGTPLFNPNDGLTGRNGGPYLDEVQARADEVRRAQVEGREPDLDKPGANAGIQLSTAAQLLASLNVANNPSMETARAAAIDKAYADSVKTDNTEDVLTSRVVDEIPDTSKQKTIQDLDTLTYNTLDPSAPSHEVKDSDEGEKDITLVEPDAPDTDTKSTTKTSSSKSK